MLAEFAERVEPYPFGNGHPRFFGWINSPPDVLAVFADALAAAMNPSVAGGNHAAVYVEGAVIGWFRDFLGLAAQMENLGCDGWRYVSRLGLVLRDRHLGVSELQRRGHPISRGALDRLMSRRPVQSVDLDVLAPVLDELGVDFRTVFEKLPPPVAQAEAIARPAARKAAQRITRRGALIQADLELEQASNRLKPSFERCSPNCSIAVDGCGAGCSSGFSSSALADERRSRTMYCASS